MIIISVPAFWLKFQVSEKPSISLKISSISNSLISDTKCFYQHPRFWIEIVAFSFEMLGILKICANRIP